MLNIAELGAKTSNEKNMIRTLILIDDTSKTDKLPNGISLDEYWKKGISIYNDNRKKITLEELKKMRERRYEFIINFFDTDVYLKPFSLERK